VRRRASGRRGIGEAGTVPSDASRKASRGEAKASRGGAKRPQMVEKASRGPHFCQAMARLATIQGMGRKDKGREICINCGQTFHKKLTSKELRCTKCRKAEKKAA